MSAQQLQPLAPHDQDAEQVQAIQVDEEATPADADTASQPVAELGTAVQEQAVVGEAVQLQGDSGAVERKDKEVGRIHGGKSVGRRRGADTGMDDRRRRLGKIHQGKKALNLGEREYRALLMRASADEHGIGGIDSSANMTEAQHLAVLREMARLGFKAADQAARKRAFPGRPKGKLSPMLGKVEALLADGKKPWSYAHAMAKRMHNVQRVEWLNDHQLHGLVAALQADANRRGK